jgi:hypothetical protein
MRRLRRRRGMGGWVGLQKLITVLDMKNGYKGCVRVGFININDMYNILPPSLCSFILPLSAFSRVSRASPWTPMMRELPQALPLRLWGIVQSSLQKRHQVRSARVRHHPVFDNLAPLAQHSANILVPPCPETPAQCGFFRSHLLVICAAKPRYTAAAAREHRRVITPRLPTPKCHVPATRATRGAL